ncbi:MULTISPECIES: hypothetical protein [unclassified Streptococcus]|uniref:hypothetical protein n=1 Tax=unclassified Streptococcus TaxID=2608887 RepID=UPI001021F35E|nr:MULTISPECIES: hypothetical protein [unclassified Streptococcus]MTQ42586.1 hypothetical protein [Streptococcus sp. BIOML-A1]RYS59426.1 hypothetical protein EAI95_08050 [Streptococcus sp. bf_0095]
MESKNNLRLKKSFLGIFITLILMFPIIMKTIQHIIFHGFNFSQSPFISVVNIVVQNFSFYATALSITFTVFVFIQNENKRNEEQNEKDRIRSEEEAKENEKNREIRIKELEAIKDKYRPTFIIEENGTNNKNIVLLMRDENLYLEDVLLYKLFTNYQSSNYQSSRKIASNIKSGDPVSNIIADSFFITAKTQIGEVILFGYLNGGIKIHKYLKDNGNPLYPSEAKDFKEYNQKEVNKNWGSYNTIERDNDNLLDQLFFHYTIELRKNIGYNFTNLIKQTLKSSTANEFFHSLIPDLQKLINSKSINLKYINKIMRFMLNTIENKIDMFQFNGINDELDIDYLQKRVKNITNRGCNQAFNFDNSFRESDLSDLITYLDNVISFCEIQAPNADNKVKEILLYICEILVEVFNFITVNKSLDDEIISYKTIIFNYIKIN